MRPFSQRRAYAGIAATLTGLGVLTASATAAPAAPAATTASWASAGHDTAGSRNNPDEHTISAANVAGLTTRWSVGFSSYTTATPAVVGGLVYQTGRDGKVWALDAATGATRWSKTVTSYTGIANDVTRATPAVDGGRVIFGDQPPGAVAHDGAHLVAVDASTGAQLWNTVVDTNHAAQITGAPLVDAGIVYVGVSSSDSTGAGCCTFRGSVVALNESTGAVLWRTYTAPTGYTGAAVWGSPVINHSTGLVYVGTGNNYTVPTGVCTAPGLTSCQAPVGNDYVDSLVAIRIGTGQVAWAMRSLNSDVWRKACTDPVTCGPDFDFGSAPNLLNVTIAGQARQLVGIGQKSGIYWAVDASTGAVVWQTRVGPGGKVGGVEWGTAYDGTRIYSAATNWERTTWTTQTGKVTNGGAWSALDPATGKLLWQVADPQGGSDLSFMSSANGLVYAGSTYGTGNNMYVLDGATGQTRWAFASGGAVMGGAAIVDGTVYWPTGFYDTTCPAGQAKCGTTYRLYAFSLPAQGRPSVPLTVTATQASASSATITWTPPASSGGSAITGYRVTRDNVDSAGEGAYSNTVSASARSFTMTRLVPGRTYNFTVAAINAGGVGPAVTVSVTISGLPSVPLTMTAAQVSASSATFTWTAPASDGGSAITGYRVTRDNVDSAGLGAYSNTVSAPTRSFTMTRLVKGRTYTFTVAAINAYGTGPAATAKVTIG